MLALSLLIECVIAAYRMLAAKRLTGIPVRSFMVNVVWHSLLPVSIAACIALHSHLHHGSGFCTAAGHRLPGGRIAGSIDQVLRPFTIRLQKLTEMAGKALAKITRKSPVLNAN